MFCNFLIAGNTQNQHTEIKGIDQKYITKASNGNIYIKNARVYTEKSNNNGQVSIKSGSNTKKIILSNVKIRSRNISTKTNKSTDAILSIITNKNTDINIRNLDIDARNVKLKTHSRELNTCAGALCIQSKNNNINIENLNISSSSLNSEVYSHGKGSKCAGALCIQGNESIINLHNVDILNSGTTLYNIEN